MTVSTVVAGLLPIMWSSSAGSEVMKPLATPVLGGMISSLLHVLIVTPVIFFWLRERQLKKQGATTATEDISDEFAYEITEGASTEVSGSRSGNEKERGSHE